MSTNELTLDELRKAITTLKEDQARDKRCHFCAKLVVAEDRHHALILGETARIEIICPECADKLPKLEDLQKEEKRGGARKRKPAAGAHRP